MERFAKYVVTYTNINVLPEAEAEDGDAVLSGERTPAPTHFRRRGAGKQQTGRRRRRRPITSGNRRINRHALHRTGRRVGGAALPLHGQPAYGGVGFVQGAAVARAAAVAAAVVVARTAAVDWQLVAQLTVHVLLAAASVRGAARRTQGEHVTPGRGFCLRIREF